MSFNTKTTIWNEIHSRNCARAPKSSQLHRDRNVLERKRFQDGFMRYSLLQTARQVMGPATDVIDLCWTTKAMAKLISPIYWALLMERAQSHQCNRPHSGKSMCLDGNAKIHRSCCIDRSDILHITETGRIIRGCSATPMVGKKTCARHTFKEGSAANVKAVVDLSSRQCTHGMRLTRMRTRSMGKEQYVPAQILDEGPILLRKSRDEKFTETVGTRISLLVHVFSLNWNSIV